MKKILILHLTTHLNIGGITTYIYLLGRHLNSKNFEVLCLSSGGEMTKQFNASGIRTFELPIKTKSELSPRLYFAIPKIIELIKREKIDLVHAHTRVTQVMAWWIKKLQGTRHVTTCHGFYKRRLGRRLLPAWGEKTIAISQPVADHLVNDFHVAQNKVLTILNAIDIEGLRDRYEKHNSSDIRKRWNLESTTPTLGVIARIVEDKGHSYLIAAISELRKQYEDIKLLIVGVGPFMDKMKQYAKHLDLTQNVIFLGNLSDVTSALAAIDIFVLPAIWREGFGLSIVEAMSLKKPVIVTNIWALNALVQDRQNGLLIEPKSTDAIVTAVNALIHDSKLRNQIGEKAHETVVKEFSIDRFAKQIASTYTTLVHSV